jgi:hypothetical protein
VSNHERLAGIHGPTGASDAIGPVGVTARIAVGAGLIGVALFWWEPDGHDIAIGQPIQHGPK